MKRKAESMTSEQSRCCNLATCSLSIMLDRGDFFSNLMDSQNLSEIPSFAHPPPAATPSGRGSGARSPRSSNSVLYL